MRLKSRTCRFLALEFALERLWPLGLSTGVGSWSHMWSHLLRHLSTRRHDADSYHKMTPCSAIRPPNVEGCCPATLPGRGARSEIPPPACVRECTCGRLGPDSRRFA